MGLISLIPIPATELRGLESHPPIDDKPMEISARQPTGYATFLCDPKADDFHNNGHTMGEKKW